MEQTLAAPTSPQRSAALDALAALGLTAGAAITGSIAVRRGKGIWYRAQRKPRFDPPDAAFGPVWTGLYGLIAMSGYRVLRAPRSPDRTRALALWAAQLGLNAGWSWLFFGARRKRAALVELGGLIAAVGAYTYLARRVDRPAAWMMGPYLAWTGFAGALNADFIRLNP